MSEDTSTLSKPPTKKIHWLHVHSPNTYPMNWKEFSVFSHCKKLVVVQSIAYLTLRDTHRYMYNTCTHAISALFCLLI